MSRCLAPGHVPKGRALRGGGQVVVAGGVDDALELDAQLRPGRRARAGAPARGYAELAADRLQRLLVAVEAEAELEDPPLALGELLERIAHGPPAECLAGLVGRIDRGRVGEQVAELAVALVADRPVQGDRRLDDAKRLLRVLQLHARRVGELLRRRLAAVLDLEALADPRRFCRRSWTCVGTRIVRDRFDTARWQAWRIHHVAYVENLKPRRQSNFSTARLRPMMPSWIRSFSGTPWPW